MIPGGPFEVVLSLCGRVKYACYCTDRPLWPLAIVCSVPPLGVVVLIPLDYDRSSRLQPRLYLRCGGAQILLQCLYLPTAVVYWLRKLPSGAFAAVGGVVVGGEAAFAAQSQLERSVAGLSFFWI